MKPDDIAMPKLYVGAVIVAYPGDSYHPPYFLKVVRTTKTLAIADNGSRFEKEHDGQYIRTHPRQSGYWLTTYKVATDTEVTKAKKLQRTHRIVNAARKLTMADVEQMSNEDQSALAELLL